MTVNLKPEEKLPVIEQHLKTLLFSQYNTNLSIMEAKASSNLNQSNLDNLNSQLADINSQISVLEKEYNTVSAQVPEDTSSN